jgi:sugar-specific transcriptional regulator TrmB
MERNGKTADLRSDDVRRLRELGLSEYGARAYLAAIKLGKADAKSISTVANVPPSKVYEVLATLEENGLLQVFPEFPKRYGALSLSGYLDALQARHQTMARRIQEEREDILRSFPVQAPREPDTTGDIMVVRGTGRVIDRLRDQLRTAKRSWLVLGVMGTPARYVSALEDVRAAAGRGVKLRFLLPNDLAEGPDATRLGHYAEIRRRNLPAEPHGEHVAIVISDDERALLIHWAASDAHKLAAEDVAILTTERAMVASLKMLIEALWMGAPAIVAR